MSIVTRDEDSFVSAAVAESVAAVNFGRPTAARRGRNPNFPWVPVIDHGPQETGVHATKTAQIPARAFAEREDAVAFAVEHIERAKRHLAADLAKPQMRALRQHHGLPRELDASLALDGGVA